MKKVVYSLLISLCLLTFPTISYADGPATVHSIFGDDMDDNDDYVFGVENKPNLSDELVKYFSGLWESSSKDEKIIILFSEGNDYTYTNTVIADNYYNPMTYYGKYVIKGSKEKGSMEVTFNNGDYLAFPYEIYGKDEYLIDNKLYKKLKSR